MKVATSVRAIAGAVDRGLEVSVDSVLTAAGHIQEPGRLDDGPVDAAGLNDQLHGTLSGERALQGGSRPAALPADA